MKKYRAIILLILLIMVVSTAFAGYYVATLYPSAGNDEDNTQIFHNSETADFVFKWNWNNYYSDPEDWSTAKVMVYRGSIPVVSLSKNYEDGIEGTVNQYNIWGWDFGDPGANCYLFNQLTHYTENDAGSMYLRTEWD